MDFMLMNLLCPKLSFCIDVAIYKDNSQTINLIETGEKPIEDYKM